MKYEVWGVSDGKLVFVHDYPEKQWQLAEKLKQYLDDEGCPYTELREVEDD